MFGLVRRRLAAVALVAVVLLALMPSGVALATQPGVNGRIAFMRFSDDGQPQVWVANPDLTQQSQLTAGTDDGWFPRWSPDAARIAFSSYRTDPDPNDEIEVHDVFTMRADGSDVRQITDSHGFNGKPSWSPDGRWLVFDADRGDYPVSQGIYIVASDGSAAPRRVTVLPQGSSWQEQARFSPDGRWIVFNEIRGGNELTNHRGGWVVGEQSALFMVRPDGTGLHQVTAWGLNASDADWSPDGRRLVFGARPAPLGNIQHVMTSSTDGSRLVDVTDDHGLTGIANDKSVWYEESFNPSWSPDGTKIIFVHVRYRADAGFAWGLETIAANGSGRNVLSLNGFEHRPDWGTAALLP
jgi:Tol biopolymer transport system component